MEAICNILYLAGAIFFILGLRNLSDPKTARRGNQMAAIGMAIALITSLLYPIADGHMSNYAWIAGALLIGSLIGYSRASKVEMTSMPQLVSLFNGLGGGSAMLLAILEYLQLDSSASASYQWIILSTLLIGAISFSGSILAYLKLDGRVKDKHVTFSGHAIVNWTLLALTIGSLVYTYMHPSWMMLLITTVLSLIYGFSFVAPIGGADMPVVISLLNSVTGISAAIAGLLYNNQIMILGGILVGASGIILTVMMCEAMNRSLSNVIFGNFSNASGGGGAADQEGKTAISTTAMDTAILLKYAEKVVVVPGYGMAVAQAQKQVKELDDYLSAEGVDIYYGIHPVAGRMPGHMNVLLAEVDISYDKLLDLDECNSELDDTDVVLVVGANDVVNPSALDDPNSSIYGMPVLEVWKAKQVIVFKRSMKPGYAGIQNPLFFKDNTKMLFGDAKASLSAINKDIKEV